MFEMTDLQSLAHAMHGRLMYQLFLGTKLLPEK